MSFALAGRYFDGLTAQAIDATLNVDAEGGVTLEPPLRPSSLQFSLLSADSRIAGLPATLRFPDGAVFETPDHDTLAICLHHFGRRYGHLHRLEKKIINAIVASVLVLGFAGVSYFWGIGLVARAVAPLVPTEVEQQLGSSVLDQLDKLVLEPTQLSSERQQQITRLFAADTAHYHGSYQLRLAFRHGHYLAANAFALPGGTIVLTDELAMLADNDAQLSGVLLHELGHLEHRHLMRNIISQSAVGVVTLLILGDAGTVSNLVLALPNILLQTAFSREAEREADDYAVAQMRQLGIATSEFGNILARLESYYHACRSKTASENGPQQDEAIKRCVAAKQANPTSGQDDNTGGWTDYLSTHPATRERIDRLSK
ncbi:MAG TPA: M48 family metallopeptidase [Candidatus Acidoferrum sp.]|nr:M48 family metallopeptidase [Candidatus Acidoferrum sp.]